MTVEFSGRHMQVSAQLRARAAGRLRKLRRVLPGLTRAHVVLGTEDHREYAEISVHSAGLPLSAAAQGGDALAAEPEA